MQVGYNHNIKHKGKDFHIQTEDSGKATMTITTLLYSAGSIVASKKANYSKIAAEYEDYSEQLKELMQKQHKQMLLDLKNGSFDDPELTDLKEPDNVKEAEDKTIEEAIEATGEKDSAGVVPEPPPKAPEEPAGEEAPPVEEGVSKNAARFVDEIINSLINTLLSLTQKNVDITKESEQITDLDALSAKYDEKIFFGQTKIYKDVTSECAFACDLKVASVIADLVLLGDGTPKEELSTDDLDALKETFNQAFGSSAPQIAALFTTKVTYDPVNLLVIDAKEEKDKLKALFTESSIYEFTLNLNIEGLITSKLHFYLTSSIKNYLTLAETKPPPQKEEVHIISEEDTSVVKAEEKLEEFHGAEYSQEEPEERELRNVELIKGIEVDIKIKLGETIMPLKKIAKLAPGTIIELNKDVDAILELVVNDKPIAEGVLVVVSTNNFAIRLSNILSPAERIKKLGGTGG
jgi:flagellar motor switch protein FliN/FliY